MRVLSLGKKLLQKIDAHRRTSGDRTDSQRTAGGAGSKVLSVAGCARAVLSGHALAVVCAAIAWRIYSSQLRIYPAANASYPRPLSLDKK